jgi:hypothetical protein
MRLLFVLRSDEACDDDVLTRLLVESPTILTQIGPAINSLEWEVVNLPPLSFTK